MKVDLHIHTTASDGCWGPEELVENIKEKDIYLFAAADHDSVGNVGPLLELSKKEGLNYIPAAEITAKHDGQICHILALGIDHTNEELLEVCRDNTERMRNLNTDQLKLLIDKGIVDLDLEEFKNYSFDRRRGGGALTNFLIDKKICKDFKESLTFVVSHVTWDGPKYPSPEEVVRIIQSAGGHPVMAHPGSTLLGDGFTDEDFDKIMALGVEGMECYTNYHTPEMTQRFCDYCRPRNLLITAGSDCHGPLLKERVLGQPEAHLEDLNLTGIWP